MSSERLQRVVMVGLATGALILALLMIGASILFIAWLASSPIDEGINVHSDSDFKKNKFPGSGTIEDPYIISGVNSKKKREGIHVRGTTQHFVIANCIFKECYEGIRLENVATGTATIMNNSISDGYAPEVGPNAGIVLESSDSVRIFNNTIINTGIYGIYLEKSAACAVLNNTITYNFEGIKIEEGASSVIANNTLYRNDHAISCFQSNFANITDNVCEDIEYESITIVTSDSALISRNKCFTNIGIGDGDGIVIGMSTNSTVSHNEITSCEYGIRAFGTTFCHFTQNTLRNNAEYGIGLVPESMGPGSQHNTIFLNAFIDNNPNGNSQALDDGISNIWFDNETKEGNYWSDWQGSGSYPIDGLASSIDQYPLSDLPITLEGIISAPSKLP